LFVHDNAAVVSKECKRDADGNVMDTQGYGRPFFERVKDDLSDGATSAMNE